MGAIALAAVGLGAVTAVRAEAVEDLLKSSRCMNCHGIDRKVVGPAYVEVAAKYRGSPGAAAMLAAKVKNGGAGVWGPVPMPPNADVSETDIRTMVAYILALKK
jgi:cytochrome c